MSNSTKENMHRETAKIAWKELERFYAQGKVFCVSVDADLVEVAAAFADDDTQSVKHLQKQGQLAAVSDEQAIAWVDQDALVWAVTVAPFILVQSVIKPLH